MGLVDFPIVAKIYVAPKFFDKKIYNFCHISIVS